MSENRFWCSFNKKYIRIIINRKYLYIWKSFQRRTRKKRKKLNKKLQFETLMSTVMFDIVIALSGAALINCNSTSNALPALNCSWQKENLTILYAFIRFIHIDGIADTAAAEYMHNVGKCHQSYDFQSVSFQLLAEIDSSFIDIHFALLANRIFRQKKNWIENWKASCALQMHYNPPNVGICIHNNYYTDWQDRPCRNECTS